MNNTNHANKLDFLFYERLQQADSNHAPRALQCLYAKRFEFTGWRATRDAKQNQKREIRELQLQEG